MGKVKNSFAEISASIRKSSPSSGTTDVSDILPLCETFIQALDETSQSAAMSNPAIGEATLQIYRLIQATKDSQIIKVCLHALLKAGRFGRILAARFVHSKAISERELASRLNTLPHAIRLALAHEMLLDYPGNHDKQTKSWLEGLMASIASATPEEVAPFISELGRQGSTLAFPAFQVLRKGVFGKWITTTLETGTSGSDLDDLCYMVAALNDASLAKTLAVSMTVGFIQPTPLALLTVAKVAEAGSKPILDMYLKILKTGSKNLAGPCLDGIIAQQTPAAGKLLATIRQKMPSLKKVATIRVPLLGDTGYRAYLGALLKDQRTKAEVEAFSALLALAPDFVESLTRTGTAIAGQIPPENGGVDVPITSSEEDVCAKPGFLARIFSKRQKTLEQLLPKFRNIRDKDLICSKVVGEELDGRELLQLNLAKSEFNDVTFIRTKIAHSDLTDSSITGGKATGCTFTDTNLSGVDFTDVVFSKCSFNDCDFNNTAFTNCRFTDCKFRNCTMGGAALLSVKMRMCGFTTTVLGGASFFETDIKSSRFTDVDFTGVDLTSAKFTGVEFISCVIQGATIYGSTFHAVDMPGAMVTGCHINNSDVAHALFLTNQVTQLTDFANQLENKALPNPNVVQPEVASKVLLAWSRELTILRREERMQTYNRSRLSRAITSMEMEKQIFIRMLPHLIQNDVFEKKFNLQNVPACDIWGYSPCLTSLELAKQYFPDIKPSKTKPEVRITAVYAMGSLGTVAQTASSDLDCWVCYEGDINLNAETGLRRKLDALGLWAESEFGLEAHFFAMGMDDVRDNRFQSGDEESSGSAQALLLKEEFYRTALRLGGKHLAWWVAPANATKETYDACIQSTRRYPLAGRPRMADFGHLAPVPPDEYFGGSLWQMVKAVHSPFKSVLKLGLLETYADPKASHMPLCSRIKQNLFMNRGGVQRTDPYAALFSILRSYYSKRGDTEAARLLTESFMFKANLCDIPFFHTLPARAEDASLVEALFGKEHTDPDTICNSDVVWSFNKSLKMGGSVRNYMVNVYQRIQGTLSKGGSTDAMINAEDLTRMGRRIGANFSKKQHKIMRVPFIDAKGSKFTTLHLSAEKAPGKKTIWVTRGGTKTEAKKKAESLQILHRSGDPVLMLAWLLANRIYEPSCMLQADRTIAPISVADLQKLMPAMYEFFPFDETFERDINEGLEPERVVRAFFIFNMLIPSEAQSVEQASVIYTTNWGEMYCRSFIKPGQLLAEHASRFLEKNLNHPVPTPPEMLMFIPKGSQCKRINLI